MILSNSGRFIFVHVPKSAGTSINGALSMHDVFFPVRGQNRGSRAKCAAKENFPEDAADLGEHASVKQFIRVLGRENYDRYFSFGFVRNPWDVAVSWFHYRLINPTVNGYEEAQAVGTFDTYARKVLAGPEGARRVGLQYPYLVDEGGDFAVSFVGRYESLLRDFETVTTKLGIGNLPLDHFNQSYHEPWARLYTPETFEIVGKIVSRDAELFGYPTEPSVYGIA